MFAATTTTTTTTAEGVVMKSQSRSDGRASSSNAPFGVAAAAAEESAFPTPLTEPIHSNNVDCISNSGSDEVAVHPREPTAAAADTGRSHGITNKNKKKANADEGMDALDGTSSNSITKKTCRGGGGGCCGGGGGDDSSDTGDDEEDDKSHRARVPALQVFKYADRTDLTLMAIGAVGAVIGGAGMPAFSFAVGRLVNDLITVDPQESAAKSALIMVYIGVGVAVACMAHVCCWCVAAVRQVARVRVRYFASVLRQDIGWHDFHKPGELTARMTGDTRVLQNGINDRLSQGILNLSMGLFGFIFGSVFCWELTLVMLGMMPFVALATSLTGIVLAKATSDTRKQFAAAGSIATEVIENVRTVQVFGKQAFELDRFHAAVKKSQKPGMKRELMNALSVGLTLCLIMLTYAVVFFFSGYLVLWRRTNIGDVVATFLSVLMGAMGIGLAFPSITAFTESRAAAFHLFETIKRVPPIDIDATGGTAIDGFRDAIELRQVQFSYPTRPDMVLFRDLNLVIKKGQKVAFSGASGCGKSSIISLLQRFYDPTGGAILCDGVDMRELDLFQWRDQIGIVSQEPNLFAGSMMGNVRIGKMNATEEEVVAACKQANIHDTIMGLPDQYNTPVGAVGSQLSGGQKQRIAIARALVKKPSILLLDEATSALDRKSEVEVQSALDELMHQSNMTIIVIAHRLATIRNVDCIYYVAYDGSLGSTIAEKGTYGELMALDGMFAAMAKTQGAMGAATAAAAGAQQRTEAAGDSSENNNGNDSKSEFEIDDEDAASLIFTGNQILTAEQLGELEKLCPLTERQRIPIEQLAGWEVQQTHISPWRLLRMNRSKTWAVLLGLLGSLVSGAIAPVNTILMGKLMNALAQFELFGDCDGMQREMRTYAPLFFPIAFAALGGWLLQFFYGYAGEHLTTKIRTVLFQQILRQDMSFFDTPSRDAGTLSGMLSGDCEAIHQLCGPAIGIRIQTLCTIIVGICIGLAYQWKLALIATACMPLIVGAVLLEQKMMSGINSQKEGDSNGTVVTEALSNVRTVTSFNLKENRTQAFDVLLAAERPKRIRRNIIVGILYGCSQFVYYGSFALCYWYGGRLIALGEADFEKVNVASLAVLMGAMSAGEAGGFAAKVGDARNASRRVFSVIDRVPDVDILDESRREVIEQSATTNISNGNNNTRSCKRGDGAADQFSNTSVAAAVEDDDEGQQQQQLSNGNNDSVGGCEVTLRRTLFIYPARPNQVVLASVSLDFPVGSVSGLMGQTGCGKSTIIQLLSCFYRHRRGQLAINGHQLQNLNIGKWRRNISIVLQEPDLFSGTVRENICYSLRLRPNNNKGGGGGDGGGGDIKKTTTTTTTTSGNKEEEEEEDEYDEPPTEAEIVRAAKWAHIHDDIMSMPEGYDTHVGYKGRALSGGQKQRVAIARGFLRRTTKLLLLDEATSALDNATEAQVQRGIEDYMRHRREAADGVRVTAISIAHRLTTIRNADQIVVLDGGRIIEQGSHEQLMAMEGEYRTRWELYAAGMGH